MIKREFYLNQILPYMKTDLIKIIVGIRRSGKSTLMKQIIEILSQDGINKEEIIYLNFEDYQIRKYKDPDILYDYLSHKIVDGKKTYIFLDEVQEVTNFEQVVNSFHATKDVDIYLTGSNSKMLSGEYATLLTGRYKSFNIFPFSFKEMVTYHKNSDLKELFKEFINHGGFPVIQGFETEDQKRSILKDLYNSIVIRDIVQRHNVSGVDALDKYISYLLNTVGSQFSAKNIINYFKNEGRIISKETLYNYISYAQEVLLIYSAKRYDLKGKKLLTTNEKYFVNDQGLRATKFNNENDIEKILENIVFFELLRRGYDVTVGKIADKEIDFIATKNNKIEYYQVTYIMEKASTREREFGSLNMIDDQYPKFVLSMDEIDFSQDGINHINIINFLLEIES
ncbi:MAG: ATP-binding protein [Candidatus Izemoplasmataceae bacterium]